MYLYIYGIHMLLLLEHSRVDSLYSKEMAKWRRSHFRSCYCFVWLHTYVRVYLCVYAYIHGLFSSPLVLLLFYLCSSTTYAIITIYADGPSFVSLYLFMHSLHVPDSITVPTATHILVYMGYFSLSESKAPIFPKILGSHFSELFFA